MELPHNGMFIENAPQCVWWSWELNIGEIVRILLVRRPCPIRSQPMTKARNKANLEHLQNREYLRMKWTAEKKRTIKSYIPFHFSTICTHGKVKPRQNCWVCDKFSPRTCVSNPASEIFPYSCILHSSPWLECGTNTKQILQPRLISMAKTMN